MNQPCQKHCNNRSSECRKTCEAWKQYEAWKREDYKSREFDRDIEQFLNSKEAERKKDIALGKLHRKRSK